MAQDAESLLTQLEGELPPEIKAEIDKRRDAREARIDSVTRLILRKRKRAVDYRRQCGIEIEWMRAEEQYEGIDDANREDVRYLKSASPGGTPIPADSSSTQATRSTAFLNITRPYTDAAVARMSDMLLPTDDRNWSIKPTPMPQLEARKGDMTPVPGMTTRAPAPVPGGAGMQPGPPPGTLRPLTVADAIQEMLNRADDQAQAAQRRIDDWLVEGQYHGEVRDVLMDCGKYGTGILKGPTPVWRKGRKLTIDPNGGGVQLEAIKEIAPESQRVSPWNFFPDPDCGSNIHDGSFVLERDDIRAGKLRDLVGLPGYSAQRIQAVIAQGPDRKFESGNGIVREGDQEAALEKEAFSIWYFYGEIDRADFDLLDADPSDLALLMSDDLLTSTGDMVPVIATLVNDEIIRVAYNPLDSGEFPYDTIPWQERRGVPWGWGVPYQIRTPQGMANAAVRNLMDNAGLAGGPILIVDQTKIAPADGSGSYEIGPRKVFVATEDAMGADVRTAIMTVDIPMVEAELLNIANFAFKMAEDVTGLPMLLQGQLGKAPDTVGGMTMLNNNASSVVRRLARLFDDRITEPHIRRYYTWLLLYGPEDSEKGDMQIDARGSTALVERDVQNQAVAQLLPLSKDPAYDLSPARCLEEWLKSQRLNPDRFKPTDAERQRMAQQQPPPPPQVAVAQIREQGANQRAQLAANVDMTRIQKESDRDTIYTQAQNHKAEIDAQGQLADLHVKWQIALLNYALTQKISLDEAKLQLAQTSAKLNLQRELAGVPVQPAHQVIPPATEPPGRAPNGEAFQR